MEEARAVRAHVYAGYGSFGAYVEAVLGYDGRTARERVRVMERLRTLPRIAAAWREGELLWASVREVARVAVPETEGEWLDVARGKSGRAVQQMVSGRMPGDQPGAPKRAEAEDAVLRFEVRASTKAMFVEAQRKLQRESGRSLDDDELLLEMARAVLEGPKELGRASYQVQMTVCEGCGTGWQQAGGEQLAVEPAAVAASMCDAQVVPSLGRPAATEAERPAGPSSAASSGERLEGERPAGPDPGRLRSPGRKRSGEPVKRASQRVPKRVRALVIRRDGGRCAVPGCNNHTWLDVHHSEPTSDGGTNDPELLVTLCGAHHRAAHEGRLAVGGRSGTGFRFTYPDGSPVGVVPPRPAVLDKMQTVASLLRGSGFRLKEANDAVARIRGDVTAEMAVEEVLRAALRQLA